MQDFENPGPVLVTGATGKTGRRLAMRLRARGIAMREGSRRANPRFDWAEPATWDAALTGARSAWLAYQPDLAAPGAPGIIGAFARRAADLGVARLVLLSGRGEPEAEAAEAAVQASGADWTVLRCSWFMQNFSESVFAGPILEGHLSLPAGQVPEPFVDADDIADVAVAALTGPGHSKTVYELTGPQSLTFAEAVSAIAATTGRALVYEHVAMEPFLADLAAQGVPPEVTGLLAYLFGTVLDGRNATPTDDVQRALGRPARSFGDFAAGAASQGLWTPPLVAG